MYPLSSTNMNNNLHSTDSPATSVGIEHISPQVAGIHSDPPPYSPYSQQMYHQFAYQPNDHTSTQMRMAAGVERHGEGSRMYAAQEIRETIDITPNLSLETCLGRLFLQENARNAETSRANARIYGSLGLSSGGQNLGFSNFGWNIPVTPSIQPASGSSPYAHPTYKPSTVPPNLNPACFDSSCPFFPSAQAPLNPACFTPAALGYPSPSVSLMEDANRDVQQARTRLEEVQNRIAPMRNRRNRTQPRMSAGHSTAYRMYEYAGPSTRNTSFLRNAGNAEDFGFLDAILKEEELKESRAKMELQRAERKLQSLRRQQAQLSQINSNPTPYQSPYQTRQYKREIPQPSSFEEPNSTSRNRGRGASSNRGRGNGRGKRGGRQNSQVQTGSSVNPPRHQYSTRLNQAKPSPLFIDGLNASIPRISRQQWLITLSRIIPPDILKKYEQSRKRAARIDNEIEEAVNREKNRRRDEELSLIMEVINEQKH